MRMGNEGGSRVNAKYTYSSNPVIDFSCNSVGRLVACNKMVDRRSSLRVVGSTLDICRRVIPIPTNPD